jgi:hypothetical protein
MDAEQQIPTQKWAAAMSQDQTWQRRQPMRQTNAGQYYSIHGYHNSQHNDNVESIHVGPHWRWPNQVSHDTH